MSNIAIGDVSLTPPSHYPKPKFPANTASEPKMNGTDWQVTHCVSYCIRSYSELKPVK